MERAGASSHAALAYDATSQIDETAVIESLVETHRRKYMLCPLLKALWDGP
jgi:hypothetical protein